MVEVEEEYLAKEISWLTEAPGHITDPKAQEVKAKFDIQMTTEDTSTAEEPKGTRVVSPYDYKCTKANSSHKGPSSGPPFKNIVMINSPSSSTGVSTSMDNKDATVAWKPGAGSYGKVESPLKQGSEERPHLGGMRNPALAVLGLPSARALGVRMIAAWESFVTRNPKATQLAERYGTKVATEDTHITKEWRSCLRKVMGSKGIDAVRLKDAHTFTSPLHADLLEAYCRSAGDPESEVHHWVTHGTPLGMAREIKTCGIFILRRYPSFSLKKKGTCVESAWQRPKNGTAKVPSQNSA